MPPRARQAIPIGDRKAALARLDALIAEAEEAHARQLALAGRRRRRTGFVPDSQVLAAEAHLARLRAQRAALAGEEGGR